MDFHPFKPQPELTGLAIPTQITFQAATETKSIYLCAYCDVPEHIVSIIQRIVHQSGGMSICQPMKSEGFSEQLLIRSQLPGLSSSDLWQIRAAIHRAGGIVETVRVNYQIADQILLSNPKLVWAAATTTASATVTPHLSVLCILMVLATTHALTGKLND